MAIDLPPAVPPTLVDASVLSQYASSASAYTAEKNGYQMQITGEHHLSTAELDKIVETAKSADQVILLISSAATRKGHLLVNVLYSRQQNMVYVHALQAKVGKVTGDDGVASFFKGLEGDADLTRSEYERAKAMAEVRSERTGIDYGVSYKVAENNPAVVDMVFTGTPSEDADRTKLSLKMSNEGSRFVGRYFGDANFNHSFGDGTQLGLGWQHAFPELGESRDGDDYDQYQISLDRPFSFGLYGIKASHTEYVQDYTDSGSVAGTCLVPDPLGLVGSCLVSAGPVGITTSTKFDAEIDRIALTGQQVLSADIDRRFGLYEELENVKSTIDENATGSALQDEEYLTLEIGARYQKRHVMSSKRVLDYTLAFSVKGGVDDKGGTLDTDSTSSGVAVGKRVGDFIVYKPRATAVIGNPNGVSASLEFSAQIAEDQLPQQQQWVLGGVNALSAYVPGIVVGDSGMFAKFELGYQFAQEENFSLHGGIFVEYGEGNFEDASGAAGDTLAVTDIGVGLKMEFVNAVEVKLVMADSIDEKNLSSEFIDDNEADFFASIKVGF